MAMIAYFRSRFAQYVTPYYGSNNPARVVDVDGINCPTPEIQGLHDRQEVGRPSY